MQLQFLRIGKVESGFGGLVKLQYLLVVGFGGPTQISYLAKRSPPCHC